MSIALSVILLQLDNIRIKIVKLESRQELVCFGGDLCSGCVKIIALLLTPLFLTLACLALSRKRFFDNDELYSYYLLSDPSFRHMWASFNDSINNSPPLYYG